MKYLKSGVIKYGPTVLLIACTVACNHTNETNSKEITTCLSGEWINLGFYQDGRPDYDTLYMEFNDRFDGSISEMIHVILTDSGTYKHVYSTETGELLRINAVLDLAITAFEFHNDSAGIATEYDLDTTKIYKEHPKIFGRSAEITIMATDTGTYVRFQYRNGLTTVSKIKELSDKQLVLELNERTTSRFKRLDER